jgi:hypothetical protein
MKLVKVLLFMIVYHNCHEQVPRRYAEVSLTLSPVVIFFVRVPFDVSWYNYYEDRITFRSLYLTSIENLDVLLDRLDL